MAHLLETLSEPKLEAMARTHYENRSFVSGAISLWTSLQKSVRQAEIDAMRAALEHVR
jgi:hypothetical protein